MVLMNDTGVDWSQFSLGMINEHYWSGGPVFKDEPKMPLQKILGNLEDGMTAEEIAKSWELDLLLVSAVKDFAESQSFARSV